MFAGPRQKYCQDGRSGKAAEPRTSAVADTAHAEIFGVTMSKTADEPRWESAESVVAPWHMPTLSVCASQGRLCLSTLMRKPKKLASFRREIRNIREQSWTRGSRLPLFEDAFDSPATPVQNMASCTAIIL